MNGEARHIFEQRRIVVNSSLFILHCSFLQSFPDFALPVCWALRVHWTTRPGVGRDTGKAFRFKAFSTDRAFIDRL
jgi:hypothetical protein